MQLLNVSVLIITRNRPEAVVAAVESVLNGEALPSEIIVVDQSDQSNSAMLKLGAVESCPVRYFWVPASGASRARNEAICHAQTEIIALIDDDITVARDWLQKLTEPIENTPETITTGAVLAIVTAGRIAPSLTTSCAPAVFEGGIERDVLFTGNMAMWRKTVHTVGWFDERLGPGTSFPAAEDNDFGLRVLAAGYRIQFVPDAVGYHASWRTVREFRKLRWAYGRGQGAFYAKHAISGNRNLPRRMYKDIWQLVVQMPRQLIFTPAFALGQIAFLAGLIVGAAHWSYRFRGSGSL